MENKNVPLDCGTGIISVFRAQPLTWKQMMSEWIDNSFGAKAKKVTFRKADRVFQIIDDGQGCDDLLRMESLASSIKTVGNKASMYGIGGVKSQIHASQAGRIEVESVTKDKVSHIAIDWGGCLREDKLLAATFDWFPARRAKTGTVITIHDCKRIKDIPRLARDLGYSYSGELREGRSIVMEIDGEKRKIKAYEHPPFSREVSFEFEFQGHKIRGFCGLVERDSPNPYPGWSAHWGYRFLGQFNDPAEGKPTNRIYAEVYLPETWKDISVNKDSFIQDDETFWGVVAEHCREIIDLADAESMEIELTTASRAAEDIIGQALGSKGRIKGARPGDAGKNGTVEPTGNGSEHRKFTTIQPGDKVAGDDIMPARTPDKVRIVWDPTIEDLYSIASSGTRGRTFILTLNDSIPQIAEFRDDPSKLATYCLGFVAREIAEGPDQVQRMFPAFRGSEFKDVYRRLLDRLAAPQHQTA